MLCDGLAQSDGDLRYIIDVFGYPPLWYRSPSFETIIHFILEQQVSLASALAALQKLQQKCGIITAEAVLALSDEELRNCYFSRQKIVYARSLAHAIIEGSLSLQELPGMSNDAVREQLTQVKGIGNWTADVFMMICLHQCDLWPVKDMALMRSVAAIKSINISKSRVELHQLGEQYRPYRTIATYLYWHAYLQKRKPQKPQKTL